MEEIKEITAEEVQQDYLSTKFVQDEADGLETVEGEMPESEELKEDE